MYDEMSIGPNPCDEQCVQVGEENYMERAREESKRFIELIRKKLGPEPPGALLRIKSNPHDLGFYLDVVCKYVEDDEEARAYAYLCESEAPRTWDDDQPLPKKRYSVRVEVDCFLTLQVEAETEHMAEIRGKALARAQAKSAGFELDDFGDIVASAQEIKEVALATPQS